MNDQPQNAREQALDSDMPDLDRTVSVPAALIDAYEAASYWVDLPSGRITLRVGERFSPPQDLGAVDRLAVVTAFNPFSRVLTEAENSERQARLIHAVETAGLLLFPAAGVDPEGRWKPEPSLGIVDPSDEQLDVWLVQFGQNAVVVANAGQPIALKLHPQCRPGS
jgi:hypothetical protein